MTRWFTCLICGIFVCTFLVGCLEEESVTSTSGTKTKKVAAKKLSKKVAPPKAKQEEKKAVEFAYVAEGRRDPFVPLSRIKKPYAADSEPATPLQSYDIAQFRLAGGIVGKGEAKAMVVAPDGKAYILARGVKIGKNNGVVVDINSETILVEEKYYDFSGNVIENIQVITVPKREGA